MTVKNYIDCEFKTADFDCLNTFFIKMVKIIIVYVNEM